MTTVVTDMKIGIVDQPKLKVVGILVDRPGYANLIYALDPQKAIEIGKELIRVAKTNGATELVGFDNTLVLPGDTI